MADASLAKGTGARTGGDRCQVIVHVDESALSNEDAGGCELEDGSPIAPATARRIACDASLVQNGRRIRTIASATRRALRTRDRGCRFPGCENRRFVDAHHVHHWADGGASTVDNLVLLCRRHHRAVHEGGYRVDRDGRFSDPTGSPIEVTPRLPRGDPEALREPGIGVAAFAACGGDERFDLAYVVDVMLRATSEAPRASP